MSHPVLECLRDHLAKRAPRRIPYGAAVIARRHRVAGTLYHIRPPMSDFDARICQQAWAEATGAHLLRLEALCRIWPADAPAPMVFKGADLAEHVYRDPGARAARDLDVLVPPGTFDAITAALIPQADEVRWPSHERLASDRLYAVGLVFEGVLIEVHAHPMPPHRRGPHGAALWARSEPWTFEGTALRRPAPLDRFAIWLANMAKDAFYGDLGDLLDGAVIRRGLDDATLDAVAKAHGLTMAWRLAQRRLAAFDGVTAQAGIDWGSLDRLLPPVGAEPIQPPQLRFQTLKWTLMPPAGRLPALHRGLASLYERLTSP